MEKLLVILIFIISLQPIIAQNHSERSILIIEPHQLNQAKIDFDDKTVYKASCLSDIPLENIAAHLWYR